MDPSLTNGEYSCLGCGEDQAVTLHLKNWLPPGYKYHFCTYRLCTPQGELQLDNTSFEASLRIALTEICEVKEWVKKLSESSGVSWRVAVTKPNKGQRVLYKVGEKKFQVRSSTSGHTYTVDMELELCTCPVGHSGAPCKHQAAVVQNYNITSINFLPTTAEMRAELLKITKASVSLDFLNPLRQNMPMPSTLPPDMPLMQESCTTDHQCHLSAQDDELHQLDPSSTSSAQLHQASPTLEDSYSNQPCVQGYTEGASIPQSPVRRMLGLLSELAENSDYSDAMTTMAKQVEKMQHNPTQLISAFYCFGKGMSVSKRAAALRRAARRPGPIIGCQPTAVARRTTKTGSRRRLTAGRPRKSNSGSEHDYSRHTRKRAVRVRHKLSESVAMNYSHQA